MACKRIYPFFLLLLAASFSVPPVLGYQDQGDEEESLAMRDPGGEDLSERTDVELIGMERELRAKLGHEPTNADLYYRLSTVYATLFDRTRKQKGPQSGEWLVKSRDALEKVLMLRPEDKVAHYNLGVVYKRLGQMERAREELKKAIRLSDPQQDGYLICVCWLQIGSVYEEQGFYDEAKEAYLQAREYDYGNEDIRAALRDVDAKRKAPETGGPSSMMGMPSMGSSFSTDPKMAAAMGQDPNAQDQGGIAQALPALGQALMQKFGGGGGDFSGQE